MSWYLIAAAGPLAFVLYQSLTKLLPKDISVFLINMYVALMSAFVMLCAHLLFSETKRFALPERSLSLVFGIGTVLALGNVAIIKSYMLGATQSEFTALFYSLLIVYGVLVGLLVWREAFTLFQGIGVLLILAGLLLVTIFKTGW